MKSSFALASKSALFFLAIPLMAGSGSIGVATTIGTVAVNQTVVSGTADLAEGSLLQTTTVPTDVHMASGTDVRLATRSAGSFFADHVSLGQGSVRVAKFNGLTVNAAQLQISSEDEGSAAVIRMTKKTVEIASVGGAVNVMDGGMLTRVAAGTKMSFQQSGGTPADQTTTGAAPAPAPKKMPSDEKTFIWVIGITAVAAIVIGSIAAAQGKSPFH